MNLEALEKLLEHANPTLPWSHLLDDAPYCDQATIEDGKHLEIAHDVEQERLPTAVLICEAINALPQLLALVRKADAWLEAQDEVQTFPLQFMGQRSLAQQAADKAMDVYRAARKAAEGASDGGV